MKNFLASRKNRVFAGLSILLASSISSAVLEGWEHTGTSDGVATYRKEVPGDPVVAFRGEGLIDAPLVRVASVVMDCNRTKEWVHQLVQCTLVKKLSSREYIVQNHLGMPSFLTDRDFVTQSKVEVDVAKGYLQITLDSVESPDAPVGQFVRGVLHGKWTLESRENGTKTFVVAEMHGDPKGAVPKWLVNLFQKAWPTKTFAALKKQVEKKDIKIVPAVAEVFGVPADR